MKGLFGWFYKLKRWQQWGIVFGAMFALVILNILIYNESQFEKNTDVIPYHQLEKTALSMSGNPKEIFDNTYKIEASKNEITVFLDGELGYYVEATYDRKTFELKSITGEHEYVKSRKAYQIAIYFAIILISAIVFGVLYALSFLVHGVIVLIKLCHKKAKKIT